MIVSALFPDRGPFRGSGFKLTRSWRLRNGANQNRAAVESELAYVSKFLRARSYARTSLADFLRDDVCAFELSAGAAGKWFAVEDAFNLPAADCACFYANRVDVAPV